MAQQDLRIVLSFSPEDQAWLRISSIAVPRFFDDHAVAPATGDALRVGGRQFIVQGRITGSRLWNCGQACAPIPPRWMR